MVTKIDSNDVGENYMWHRSFTTSSVLILKFSYLELNINFVFHSFFIYMCNQVSKFRLANSSSLCINVNVSPLTNANNKYKILQ